MSNLTKTIKDSFSQYAGAVLQSRALVDVRDCVKPSARQIFYSMKQNKLDASHPFKKTNNAIGLAMADYYIHGDSSCEGIIMRHGQPFAMRYPLVEVQGGGGNLMDSGNWSAPRYTEARLSVISDRLFDDIDKNTVSEWRDNYDDTKQYPAVLPSKGYYNICNGALGIGIGMGASIPQFNLKEINAAMERLLLNPQIEDSALICMPDFATGALLLNAAEVRESLIKGSGKACQLRSVISYDEKDHCLVVTEIPYGVYTNTICKELNDIITSDTNPGIDRFNDLTGEQPLIKIYLTKTAQPSYIINFLFKNTSLQSWYGINLTMLDKGRFPKQFTWKQTLQAHIDHEKEVYRRGFEYDLNKAEARKHIVEGIIIAIANIDEVVKIIKSSVSTVAAAQALCENFNLDNEQAKAIMDIKLARLAHLEVEKFKKELTELENTIAHLNLLLNDTNLFNQELIKGWREVAAKYGDARRTKITEETDEVQTIKPKKVLNLFWTNGTLTQIEPPKDKTQLNKRGTVLFKQNIICGYLTTNKDTNYVVTSAGKIIPIDSAAVGTTEQNYGDVICAIKHLEGDFLVTVSRKGVVKKTSLSEYAKVGRSAQIVKLRDDDSLIWAGCGNSNDSLLILGKNGGLVKFPLTEITPTGKLTIGSKGIADEAICATIAAEDDKILTIADGKAKFTLCSEFNTTAKGGKGQVIGEHTTTLSKITDPFYIADGGKIIPCTTSMFATKSKTAVGQKITENLDAKIVI